MTFENITHFLSKEPHQATDKPATSQDILSTPVDPDNRRARRNRLAELSTQKKAA